MYYVIKLKYLDGFRLFFWSHTWNGEYVDDRAATASISTTIFIISSLFNRYTIIKVLVNYNYNIDVDIRKIRSFNLITCVKRHPYNIKISFEYYFANVKLFANMTNFANINKHFS